MIREIALILILGKPLVVYLGILTFLFLLFTASISILNKKGIRFIDFKWHPRMAMVTIGIAIIHATLAASIFYGF